jgi:hypothetical protein
VWDVSADLTVKQVLIGDCQGMKWMAPNSRLHGRH